ncbi:MAG: hypothetical protein WD382_08445 [Halofilum sp. (in: g-proteobacteria)]
MIFEVTAEDIAQLGDDPLRRLVALLAEQELSQRGLSPAAVLSGGDQNAKDGGIDVRVELGDEATIDGFVPRRATGFQAKATDMPASKIRDEMAPDGTLLKSIEDIAEGNGAYIIVSSKGSVADTPLKNRREAMRACVARAKLNGQLLVDFYDRQRLATWVNQHPGLINWVKTTIGQPFSGWRPFCDWSSAPSDEPYLHDDQLRLNFCLSSEPEGIDTAAGIERLRDELRKPKSVVRLVGLSGVGKTKLVHALFDDRAGEQALSPSEVIYTDISDNPHPVPQELLSLLHDLGRPCVLIIDNCGAELHGKLALSIKNNGAHVRLITVEYDISDDTPENTNVVRMEPSSPEIVRKIVEQHHPTLSSPETQAIANFSEGNARVALAIASTSEPGQSLANLTDGQLFERLFRQRKPDAPDLTKAAQVCSLVYSFDAETQEDAHAELLVLASLARISHLDLYAQVAELKQRHLVQSRGRWRAILPHALAQRLAKQAIQRLPISHIAQLFTNSKTPERLIKSFSKRLGDLHDVAEVRALITQWLSPGGWLGDIGAVNELGQTLFSNVASVDIDATLDAIERAVESNRLTENQGVLSAMRPAELLRSICYDVEYFDRAALLLATLAGTKTKSNNTSDACNIFRSLFFILLSGTHANVEQRIDVLRKLAERDDKPSLDLLINALEAMLETRFFSSPYNHQFGSRRRDFGYQPATNMDVSLWFESALKFCVELDEKSTAHSQRVRRLLTDKIPNIASQMRDGNQLINIINQIRANRPWPDVWSAVRKAHRLAAKDNSSHAAALEQLAEQLTPSSLEEKIAVYALAPLWSSRDLGDFDPATDGEDASKIEAKRKSVDAKCEAIGAELVQTPGLLQKHLPLLWSREHSRLWQVGAGAAAATPDLSRDWELIRRHVAEQSDEERDASANVLVGYVDGASQRDPKFVQDLLDSALSDPTLTPYIVVLHTVFGLDDQGLKRLIDATQIEEVRAAQYHRLAWGRTTDDLTSEQFCALWSAVYTMDDSYDHALELLYMRCFSMRREDQRCIGEGEIRCAEILLAGLGKFAQKDREAHRLKDVIEACIQPGRHETLVRDSLKKLRRHISAREIYTHDCAQFIGALSQKFPRIVLEELLESFNEDEDLDEDMVFTATRAVGHLVSPFSGIPAGTLFEWVEESPERRTLVAAHMIRAWKSENENADGSDKAYEWTDAAMELIDRTDQKEQVLHAYLNRMEPRSWTGSRAEAMRKRIPLLEALQTHDDPIVANWALAATRTFSEDVERERKAEEKGNRERDERFEW